MLDPGLTPNELNAIRRALLVEDNPSHLIGFASCLSPYFPVSAGLLYARSQLLELREQKLQRDLAADGNAALEELRALIDRASRGACSGARAAEWILCPIDTAENLADATMRATRNAWVDVAQGWKSVSPPVVPWPCLNRMRAAAEGVSALADSDSRVRQAGLALCQPSPRGRSLAASLQMLAFHEHYAMTRGATLMKRMDDLLYAGGRAARNGTDVRSELLARRRMDVSPPLRYEAALLAGQLVLDPSASTEGVDPSAACLARAAVVEVGPGIWIVDPRFHAPSGPPITRRPADWKSIADERARWVDWHLRASSF